MTQNMSSIEKFSLKQFRDLSYCLSYWHNRLNQLEYLKHVSSSPRLKYVVRISTSSVSISRLIMLIMLVIALYALKNQRTKQLHPFPSQTKVNCLQKVAYTYTSWQNSSVQHHGRSGYTTNSRFPSRMN